MANTKSTQHEIDLTSELNLNKFKVDIKNYSGFNSRNSPYYGGCLSPLYIKDEGTVAENTRYYNGHNYSVKYVDGTTLKALYKDDIEIKRYEANGFVTESITVDRTGELVDYYDDNNYVVDNGSNFTVILNGLETTDTGSYVDSRIFVYNGTSYALVEVSGNKVYLYKSTSFIVSKYWNLFGNDLLYDKNFIRFSGSTDNGTDYVVAQCNSALFWFETSDIRKVNLNMTATFQDPVRTTTDCTILPYINGKYLEGFFVARYTFENSIGTVRFDTPLLEIHSALSNLAVDGMEAKMDLTYSVNQNAVFYYSYYSHAPSLEAHCHKNSIFPFIQCGIKCTAPVLPPGVTITPDLPCKGWACVATNGLVSASNGFINSFQVRKSWEYSLDTKNGLPCPGGGITYTETGKPWRLLASNEGYVQGISYTEGSNENEGYIGTLLTPWNSVSNDRNIYFIDSTHIVYFDELESLWKRITIQDTLDFNIIGDYAVVNTISYKNSIRLNDASEHHWANDWNNRINCTTMGRPAVCFIKLSNNYTDDDTVWSYNSEGHQIGSSINPNYLDAYNNPPPSAILAVHEVYVSDLTKPSGTSYEDNIQYGLGASQVEDLNEYPGIYILGTGATEQAFYKIITGISGGLLQLADSTYYDNTNYPVGRSWFNLPLTFSVVDSTFDITFVKLGSTTYQILYYDNKIVYQYSLSSQSDLEMTFVIQGQTYGIARDRIYQVSYANYLITGMQAVTSITGLEYVGSTIYKAYFFSPTAKALFAFDASNNLTLMAQSDTVESITGTTYIPSTSSILIGTPDCLYILNEMFGVYRVDDIKGFSFANQTDTSSIRCVTTDGKSYVISYEPADEYEKKNVIVDTAFYGAGSNIVSVNDTWYVRVTDPNHGSGKIKMVVSSLTDVGRKTEEKVVDVKAKDWDEMTDTIYIRFQPHLQRAVGVSLHLESPFKVAYIGVGAVPETLQLNKTTI